MDESITPLLYRVNGLYNEYKISSILVVGGVGDWLGKSGHKHYFMISYSITHLFIIFDMIDVPHSVIRLEKYVASDALEKARSSEFCTISQLISELLYTKTYI